MGAYAAEKITIEDTPIGFSFDKIYEKNNRPQYAVIGVENAPIRFLLDGDLPTATTGTLVQDGTFVTLEGEHDIREFRAIREGAVSAAITVQYFNNLN